MMYLEDRTTQTAVLDFFGTEALEVAEIVRRVTSMYSLRPYTKDELLADVVQLHGREKSRAVIRLALVADDDPEYFEAIRTASRDPEPEIRVSAAWSTIYLSGAESLAMLAEMADGDPAPDVRKAAAELLAEFA
jgi:HEAT repeat protein